MTIEFLAEYENFDKGEIDEVLNQLKDSKVDKNALVLTTFTKALIMASRPKKKVIVMPKGVVAPAKQVAYQPLQRPLPEAPHPHIVSIVEELRKGTEKQLILSKATNEVMASAKINNNYELTEPAMSDAELKVLDAVKKKFGKNVSKDSKFLEKKKDNFTKTVKNICKKFKVSYSDKVLDKMNYYLVRDSNFGKIDPLTKDNDVESISCDSISTPVTVNYNGRRLETNIQFKDKKGIKAFVEELAKKTKKKLSKKEPILDATLNNLRIQATLGSDIVSSKFVIKRV